MAIGQGPLPNGHEDWCEFLEGLIPLTWRLDWHTAPATQEVRAALLLEASRTFAYLAEEDGLMEHFVALRLMEPLVARTREEALRLRQLLNGLRERIRADLYRCVCDAVRRFVEARRGAPSEQA